MMLSLPRLFYYRISGYYHQEASTYIRRYLKNCILEPAYRTSCKTTSQKPAYLLPRGAVPETLCFDCPIRKKPNSGNKPAC